MNKKKINEELLQQKQRLILLIQDTKKRLKNAPKGQVRVARHGKGYQFYLREEPSDIVGKYLPVSKRKLAVALVQKKYDIKIIRVAEKQVAVIDRFLRGYDPDILKECYKILSPVINENVFPVELPDQEYVKEWLAYEYSHKGFAEGIPEQYTSNGERVRSKSEVLIADALKQAGVPYRYECPLEVGSSLIHPDFTILRIEDREQLYWEHLGMMDDPDYCQNAFLRLRQYEANGIWPGINLILSVETSTQPVNLAVINNLISAYCL